MTRPVDSDELKHQLDRLLTAKASFDRAAKQAQGDRLTVSIGVAASGERGYDADALLLTAEEALEAAKQGGKNRVVLGGR